MCEYPVKRVKAGAIAFREMDRKIFVYRVHSGALCLTNSQSAAVAFAFPGDFVGLGFFDQLDAATEKEFEHQRLRLSATGATSPIARVASYLLAISAMNMREGKDPNLVEEPSAPVASFLKVSADQLSHILSLFQTLDLIRADGPSRLSLKDLDGLRDIAAASIGQVSGHTSGVGSETRVPLKARANG